MGKLSGDYGPSLSIFNPIAGPTQKAFSVYFYFL